MLDQYLKLTLTSPDLSLYGEVQPESALEWAPLPAEHRRVWMECASALLPRLIHLFQPRYVILRYHSLYEARLLLGVVKERAICHGPISIIPETRAHD